MLKTQITMQYILKYLHVRNILLENRSVVHTLCMTATFTTHEDNSWAWVHEEKATVCKGSYAVSSYICIMTCFCHEQPFLWDSICVSTWKGFPNAKWQRIVAENSKCYKVCGTNSAMNPRWDFPIWWVQFLNNSFNTLPSPSETSKPWNMENKSTD